MAEIRPLSALHYAPDVDLDDVVAPPYDVIDDEQRAALLGALAAQRRRDRPAAGRRPVRARGARRSRSGRTRASSSATTSRRSGSSPRSTRRPTASSGPAAGFFAAVRVEDYGPGRIRPHERTHPGPKEDRLRLTRATQGEPLARSSASTATPSSGRGRRCEPSRASEPFGDDDRRRRHRQPPVARRPTRTTIDDGRRDALGDAELLIADGHHRYETARVYARGGRAPRAPAGCSCASSRSRTRA